MIPVLESRSGRPVTRFAPSVTGWLHLGHVAHAVVVWGIARAVDARVVFRLEDHDRGRYRPEYERAILEDLTWLGLEADEGLDPLNRQSDCNDRYVAALDRRRGGELFENRKAGGRAQRLDGRFVFPGA